MSYNICMTYTIAVYKVKETPDDDIKRSKDSQVKTQLVLWIFILFKVTTCFGLITRPSSGNK
jgi:hypothetical protein